MNTASRNVDVSPRIVRAGCTQRAYQTIRIYARAAESRGKHAWSYSSAGSVLTLTPALFLLAILSFPFFVSSRCFQANKRTEATRQRSRASPPHITSIELLEIHFNVSILYVIYAACIRRWSILPIELHSLTTRARSRTQFRLFRCAKFQSYLYPLFNAQLVQFDW